MPAKTEGVTMKIRSWVRVVVIVTVSLLLPAFAPIARAADAKAATVATEQAQKDPSAVFVVAVCYMTGHGVAKADPSTGVEALQQAADSGDLRAMKELAACYAQGDGIAKDPAKAFQWFTKAA